MTKTSILSLSEKCGDISLRCPKKIPNATGYLWNRNMLLNISCRGFANTHFMQPEPSSYSTGPALEAKTFMQPEHQYYQGHPGRFFFIKDHESEQVFSLPYEPMNRELEKFEFVVSEQNISWKIQHMDWLFTVSVSLTCEDPVELWQINIENLAQRTRQLTVYPCFHIGYQSWMNQSADYDASTNSIIGNKVSPYQRLEDYPKQKQFKELTFLTTDRKADSWTCALADFIGDTGWSSPIQLNQETLSKQAAIYETPVAVMQFDLPFAPAEAKTTQLIFGAANTKQDIVKLRQSHFSDIGFSSAKKLYQRHYQSFSSCLQVQTPDAELNTILNVWLPRQVTYHGEVNRLTTDPQTRNFLQDAMGMCFVAPESFRQAFVLALSQQHPSGEMPDGILLHQQAELKYINNIPHADHSVWLPICLQAYLNETNKYPLLDQVVAYKDSLTKEPVWKHINKAMVWLEQNLDHRGLSLIHQGDWCDPMNMVGHKGQGVSSWLTMATAHAFNLWSQILAQMGKHDLGDTWSAKASALNNNINQYFWDGHWYARGISDDGTIFGTQSDDEGKIYLNPQTWSILSHAANKEQQARLHQSIKQHLETPHGIAMLSPCYTQMVEHIGRLTQKFPGVAENGSLYNHASAFYLYALYKSGKADEGFNTLTKILTLSPDAEARGQLPNFVPNYYRGAMELHPGYVGRSSRLFNTGTVSWLLRVVVEHLFGLQGTTQGLKIAPQLPSHWSKASVTRQFRGKSLRVNYYREPSLESIKIVHNGIDITGNSLKDESLQSGDTLDVYLP